MSKEDKYLNSHFRHGGHSIATFKNLCCNCLKSGKGDTWTCGKSDHKSVGVGSRIRLPSPKANKRKWLKTIKDTSMSGWMILCHPEEWGILLSTVYNKK